MKFLWNSHIGLCVDRCFCFSWVSAFKWNCWLICTCIFHFIRNCPKCCKVCDFSFPPAMHESCSFSRPCQHLIFVHLFNGSHSSGYLSNFSLQMYLHFSYDQCCWAVFHVLLAIRKASFVQCHHFANFKNVLFIEVVRVLDTGPLLKICFVNVFSPVCDFALNFKHFHLTLFI